MKCPECGKEIKEGSLFCEFCSHEVKIVPEYDSQIEQQLRETMTTITDELSREDQERRQQEALKEKQQRELRAQEEKQRKDRTRLFIRITAIIVSLLVLLAIAGGIYYRQLHSASYYVGRAYTASEEGDYERAAELIGKAKTLPDADTFRLQMLQADYLLRGKDYDAAEGAVLQLAKNASLSEEQLQEASGELITILAEQGKYEEIRDYIEESGSWWLKTNYSEYLAEKPVIDMASGTYEDRLILTMTAGDGASIFYTLDGQTPGTKSLLYQAPVELQLGEYEVCAAAFNRYGVMSEVEQRSYTITATRPEAPKVLTQEGLYERATLISVAVPEGETVYYTTDESDPDENSLRYERPINMPIGTTTFRFVSYGRLGIPSEITEVTYTLTPKGNLSPEAGINYILVALINRSEIIDILGTLPGGTASVSYQYTDTRQLSGQGKYYVYDEILSDLFGNQQPTGRRFAVNITNGTVNLLDAQGGLIPIG